MNVYVAICHTTHLGSTVKVFSTRKQARDFIKMFTNNHTVPTDDNKSDFGMVVKTTAPKCAFREGMDVQLVYGKPINLFAE